MFIIFGAMINSCDKKPKAHPDQTVADIIQTPSLTPTAQITPHALASQGMVAIPTPVPTPTPTKYETIARQRQYALALENRNFHDYWTSQVAVLKRHNKQTELSEALQKQQEYRDKYQQVVTDAFFQELVSNEIQKEQARVEAEAKERRLAPARARAREAAEEANAFSEEFDKHYNDSSEE